MKKILLFVVLGMLTLNFACTVTGDGNGGDNPKQTPHIYGDWNVTSVKYATSISLAGQTLPVEGTSSESSYMNFKDDNTCMYSIVIITDPITIPGLPVSLPAQTVTLADTGTYTFDWTESTNLMTKVKITNKQNQIQEFTVTTDELNRQIWKTVAPYEIPGLGAISVNLDLDMTRK